MKLLIVNEDINDEFKKRAKKLTKKTKLSKSSFETVGNTNMGANIAHFNQVMNTGGLGVASADGSVGAISGVCGPMGGGMCCGESLETTTESLKDEVTPEDVADAMAYYEENAFGYDGLKDYVETDFSHRSAEYRKNMLKSLKKKLSENLTEGYNADKIKTALVNQFNTRNWNPIELKNVVGLDKTFILSPRSKSRITCEADVDHYDVFELMPDGKKQKSLNFGGKTLDRIAKQFIDASATYNDAPIEKVIRLVGVTHSGAKNSEDIQANIASCIPGQDVKLVRIANHVRFYSNNIPDECAVEVRTTDNKSLGYIPAVENERIARKLVRHTPYTAKVKRIVGGYAQHDGTNANYGIEISVKFD